MQPLYFNPLDNTGNFIGTNPLKTTGIPIKTTYYPYFNPSIYQSFTFYSFPIQPFYSTKLINAGQFSHTEVGGLQSFVTGGSSIPGGLAFSTMEFFSEVTVIETQFSTFGTFYASWFQLQPVTYSVRFGTETQPLLGSYNGAVETWNTYRLYESQQFAYYSYIVATWVYSPAFGWQWYDSNPITGLQIYASQVEIYDQTTLFSSSNIITSPGEFYVGSSSFVNIMGSNVYSGLLDTTNSIIIYQNEQVSSYYSQSLSYQVNIANLTAALNSVSGNNAAAAGKGTITVTNFSWIWESTSQGWTGSQLTDFPNYTYKTEVNVYLSVTYGGTVITNSTVAVTQIQSLITVQNNDLANSQTFMNNAVTTLQSQVSLAGQIIGTLSSIMQSIINNI